MLEHSVSNGFIKQCSNLSVIILAFVCALAGEVYGTEPLDTVLQSVDRAAAKLNTIQCTLVSDQYQKVVDEHDIQRGIMYVRRSNGHRKIAVSFVSPVTKYVLYDGKSVTIFAPSINQATSYDAEKNREAFDSILALGFGASSAELRIYFDIRLLGSESVNGINAAKLELVPKSNRVRNMFSRIVLWVDQQTGLGIRQEFVESSGDYRLTTFSSVQENRTVADDVFILKTNKKTRFVKP